MRLSSALAMAVVVATTTACSLLPFGYGTEDRPLAMASWGAEWEPLREVYPPDVPGGVQVIFMATGAESGGIEGDVTMVRLEADGAVVLDRRLPEVGAGAPHTLAPGDYDLTGYYRTCDANCGYLDPPEELCSTELSLTGGRTYLVLIGAQDGCLVTESDG